MRVHAVQVAGSPERFNADVYAPARRLSPGRPHPGILIVPGGGGKDLISGEKERGKYAAAYHDLAQHLSACGYWAFVPSRRGDPKRTPDLSHGVSPAFRARFPVELYTDAVDNDGGHTHMRQVAELKSLVSQLEEMCAGGLDPERLGILGKSAGGGVALALATEMPERFASLLLWGSALRTSQWFENERADEYFTKIFSARRVRYDRGAFLDEMCDAIDYIKYVTCPALFACTFPDPYRRHPPEPDPYASVEEQLGLLRYAVNAHYGRVSVIKGAEHTMHSDQPAWQNFACAIVSWLDETLSFGAGLGG